ncbi:MAG: Hpt domain-containing protein [Hyphomicrobiaceae bacterium]|nr:Hpt domain-containing protein [Hyphomicrobiaceae bacterium]MCC0009963.1 Hpt domain-containing protein [Hyphomicrobiaceae bacterium]
MNEPGLTRGYAIAAKRARAGAASRRGSAPTVLISPIDHDHLARYTFGDRELEIEVLDLFLGEVPRTMDKLNAAVAAEKFDPKAWHYACHTLKGSARAVGAFDVARAAERAENIEHLSPEYVADHIAEIARTLATAAAYIETWRKG